MTSVQDNKIDKYYAQIIEDYQLINYTSTRYQITKIKRIINNLDILFKNNFVFEDIKIISHLLYYIYVIPSKSMYSYKTLESLLYTKENILKINDININVITNYSEKISYELLYYIIAHRFSDKTLKFIENMEIIDGDIICGCLFTDIKNYYHNIYFKSSPFFVKFFSNKKLNLKEKHIKFFEDKFNYCSKFLYDYYLENNICPSNNILEKCIIQTNLKFVTKIYNLGCDLSPCHLNIACKENKDDIINFIIDNNIQPTNDTLTIYINNLKNIYSYTDTSIYNNNFKNIDKLILHGSKLVYNHIVTLTKKKRELPNIDKYDITFEDNFLSICLQYNFYPYKNIIKLTQNSFEILCTKINNISEFKKLLKDNPKIKITQKCFENICINGNNAIINFILNKKLKVTPICIKNIMNSPNNSLKCMEIFLENYINLENKYINLENKYINLENKYNNLENKYNNLENIDNNLENIDKKYIIEKNDDNVQNSYKNTELKISLLNIPDNFNWTCKKLLIKKSFLYKILKLSNNKINFIDCRKLFIKYLQTNMLLNKNKIIINNEIYSILNNHYNSKSKHNYEIYFYELNKLIYNLFIKSI